MREIVSTCGELNIEYLTLYTFSTENWTRPKIEVTALWRLLLRTIRSEVDDLNRNNVRLMTIGKIAELPPAARRALEAAISLLRNNTGLTLNLALSYSSRGEITSAVKSIVNKVLSGAMSSDEIDEAMIEKHLDTAEIPDPDLLIRTSGELRISNFLLWQIAYAEIYVANTLWPDFRQLEFLQALEAYQNRERRFGQLSEQIKLQKSAVY